jgi:hypothetical protein
LDRDLRLGVINLIKIAPYKFNRSRADVLLETLDLPGACLLLFRQRAATKNH